MTVKKFQLLVSEFQLTVLLWQIQKIDKIIFSVNCFPFQLIFLL